ncbi:MAG: BlaI/MecI/CopY family transcriptional regulator [Acidobacteriota bacterium]|nr:BlaI/MecI/CopY family transcriptional regulator [Acidobacteriota bacterium]
MPKKIKLSNFELEVMQCIWDNGEIIAPDVHKLIAANRKISYSSVKTIFDRLEEKGAIRRVRTYGRTILWAAAIQKEDVAGSLVADFMDRMFGGKVRPLMSHVLQKEDLTMDDISYLEGLLEERKKDLEAGK